MARKSKLTEAQWLEIERRAMVDGESVLALSYEFNIDERAIRDKIKPKPSPKQPKAKSLRELASNQVIAEQRLASVQDEVAALPMSRQVIVRDIVSKMRAVSEHLTDAALAGAEAAAILNKQMLIQAKKYSNPASTFDDREEAARTMVGLSRAANSAAEIPLNLFKIKEGLQTSTEKPAPVAIKFNPVSARKITNG